MSQAGYLALAIGLLVALAAIALITFIALRRMPAPKGCEDIKTNKEKCGSCQEAGCPLYSHYHAEEEEGR